MTSTQQDHVINSELIKMARAGLQRFNARHKRAFVPGGDPMMQGGDPAAAGGAPPGGGAPPPGGGDPAAMGMDPSMMGGAPPGGAPPGGDPSAMMGMGMPPPPPGGGGDPALGAKLDQLIQMMQGGGVGAQSGSNMAGQLKPKIDVNVALMQISKMLARIADTLGVKIPASEMIATPTDLTQMASKQQMGGQQDAAMMGGGAPGGIQPMGGMPDMSAGPGAAPKSAATRRQTGHAGVAYDAGAGLEETMNKAAAIAKLRRRGRGRS